eukprot:COSAG04_NODE_16_length_40397_cov_59.653677_21_plen_79_part_00
MANELSFNFHQSHAGSLSEPEPEPAEEGGPPEGNELADGSQVEVLKGDANLLGRGASGIVTVVTTGLRTIVAARDRRR